MDPKDLSNDYPYTKPAIAVYSPSNEAKLQPFLDFIASEEAKALLAKQNISAPIQ
jgi:hypothetical protein